MTERLDGPQEHPEGHLPNHPVSAWTRQQFGCKCQGCLDDQRKIKGQKSRDDREAPEHGTITRYNSKRYKCRCDLCTDAIRTYRREYARTLRAPKNRPETEGLPLRPPGIVWVDDSGITTVVRCERCNKNYGPWIFDKEAAAAFRKLHHEMHAGEAPFDWSAWDQERLIKHPGGRPPLEDKPMCSAEDCTEDAHARGLCNTHYRRALREAS